MTTQVFERCRFGNRVATCYHVPRCEHQEPGNWSSAFGRWIQGCEPMACDNCGTELRASAPSGQAFSLVHADGGMRQCPDSSGNRAAYQGQDFLPYVMG